jgi:hypothetical protein
MPSLASAASTEYAGAIKNDTRSIATLIKINNSFLKNIMILIITNL